MNEASGSETTVPMDNMLKTNRSHTVLAVLLPPLAAFVIIASIWEITVRALELPAYILPAPSRIWASLIKDGGSILGHTGITLFEAVVGFTIGSVLGALLGIVFAYSRLLARGLLPYVIATNTIPVVAIAPIIILWFGHVSVVLSAGPEHDEGPTVIRPHDHGRLSRGCGKQFSALREDAFALLFAFRVCRTEVERHVFCHRRDHRGVHSGRPRPGVRHHDRIPHP